VVLDLEGEGEKQEKKDGSGTKQEAKRKLKERQTIQIVNKEKGM
jgi:hypothetical protein